MIHLASKGSRTGTVKTGFNKKILIQILIPPRTPHPLKHTYLVGTDCSSYFAFPRPKSPAFSVFPSLLFLPTDFSVCLPVSLSPSLSLSVSLSRNTHPQHSCFLQPLTTPHFMVQLSFAVDSYFSLPGSLGHLLSSPVSLAFGDSSSELSVCILCRSSAPSATF